LLSLRRWINALASRRHWLEARLEHIAGLQTILEDALASLQQDDRAHP
jgi:hypothetical protein